MTFYRKIEFTLRFINSYLAEMESFFGERSYFFITLLEIKKSLQELKKEIETRVSKKQILKEGGKELVTKTWVRYLRKRIVLLQSVHSTNMANQAYSTKIVASGRSLEEEVATLIGIIQVFYEEFK